VDRVGVRVRVRVGVRVRVARCTLVGVKMLWLREEMVGVTLVRDNVVRVVMEWLGQLGF